MKKATPIMIVDAIEPCLPFWTERLGFVAPVQVPHGDHLGFVILSNGTGELMYQTHASLLEDLGAAWPAGGAVYLEVESIDNVIAALQGADVVVPPRTTFYGSREIWVREPGGNLVGFAQPAARE
ncbi:MAG: hypothetical protein JWM80_1476 [Cyanobacteria bacterium RYN_339]|nr:hypothetical protein [Cyanobacteria bacterium RYN_339]